MRALPEGAFVPVRRTHDVEIKSPSTRPPITPTPRTSLASIRIKNAATRPPAAAPTTIPGSPPFGSTREPQNRRGLKASLRRLRHGSKSQERGSSPHAKWRAG